jgi:hypothetical protein
VLFCLYFFPWVFLRFPLWHSRTNLYIYNIHTFIAYITTWEMTGSDGKGWGESKLEWSGSILYGAELTLGLFCRLSSNNEALVTEGRNTLVWPRTDMRDEEYDESRYDSSGTGDVLMDELVESLKSLRCVRYNVATYMKL